MSRMKSSKRWVSLDVRWETLGLASSTVAFMSCWTKQYYLARADDPRNISIAFGTQQTSFILLALPTSAGTNTFIWVVPQQAIRDTAWKLTISSLVLCLLLHVKPSSVVQPVFPAMGLGIPLPQPEVWAPPALSCAASLSLSNMLLRLCSPPCPLCPREAPGQATLCGCFRCPYPHDGWASWPFQSLRASPRLWVSLKLMCKRTYRCCGFILLLRL